MSDFSVDLHRINMEQENSTQEIETKEKELFSEQALEDDLDLEAEVDDLPL